MTWSPSPTWMIRDGSRRKSRTHRLIMSGWVCVTPALWISGSGSMKTWQEAQSYCREKHADLISGTKQLQDEEVKKLMNSSDGRAYTGLFRDNWRWSDGSSFSFRHWNKNFNNPESISDQCAMTVFDDGGRWKNVSCAERKPFICYDGEFLLK
uniref:C-type lectin domain-containing protein n=1 Tax=Poecilia latipinna TaxID=48699 RepID=A0A3B3UWZ3_9TELE